jgi:protein tyrosine phosphatase
MFRMNILQQQQILYPLPKGCYELCKYIGGVYIVSKEHKHYLTNNNGNIIPRSIQDFTESIWTNFTYSEAYICVTILNEMIIEMIKLKRNELQSILTYNFYEIYHAWTGIW